MHERYLLFNNTINGIKLKGNEFFDELFSINSDVELVKIKMIHNIHQRPLRTTNGERLDNERNLSFHVMIGSFRFLLCGAQGPWSALD